jgi:hypothetical protein
MSYIARKGRYAVKFQVEEFIVPTLELPVCYRKFLAFVHDTEIRKELRLFGNFER